MNVKAETLRTLHRLHRQLSDVRERLERGPKQVAAGQAAVVHCEEQLKQAKENHLKARVTYDRKQLQLREREARVANLKQKLNQASSNREYQALKEQIAADEQANRVLEDEMLEVLEQIDQLQAQVRESENRLSRTKAELERITQQVREEKTVLEAELVRLSEELRVTEESLPAEFRVEYQRVVHARGEKALAPLNQRYCGNCNCALTPQAVQQIRLEHPVFCRSCGVLLYLPEAS